MRLIRVAIGSEDPVRGSIVSRLNFVQDLADLLVVAVSRREPITGSSKHI